MKIGTFRRMQDIALVALSIYCILAAFLWAANPFSSAAFIGTALICAGVLVVMARAKKNPAIWAPRLAPARRVLWALVGITVALYVLGLFLRR
jgi:hypothetical protein